ncbi:MAG: ABC transporter ATP-binding protein [Clostridiales Family XIII bacterium]|jgi:putative ABC transport system ATP-binding protein|nr:ABC transporter ATP-binding protein [Clostridiales Family XIII bacterium]
MAVIELKGIKRHYAFGEVTVKALDGVDVSIERTEFVAIMGASGSGKSTLMNVIGCLDVPSSGTYILDGLDTSGATDDGLADIRNKKIGFVFQGFNLLQKTTALENVELPLLYDRAGGGRNVEKEARAALERVGLGERLHHIPNQLSGGQQQRVAIARALVTRPAIIIADEPTGNLDTEMSNEIMSLFKELNESGITIVMVTHEADIALWAGRKIVLRDGRVIREEHKTDAAAVRPLPADGGTA